MARSGEAGGLWCSSAFSSSTSGSGSSSLATSRARARRYETRQRPADGVQAFREGEKYGGATEVHFIGVRTAEDMKRLHWVSSGTRAEHEQTSMGRGMVGVVRQSSMGCDRSMITKSRVTLSLTTQDGVTRSQGQLGHSGFRPKPEMEKREAFKI
jgi:hypothetical protein